MGAPVWASDGQSVIFRDEGSGVPRLDRVTLNATRTTLPIMDSLAPSWPSVSPDGHWVYFSAVEGPERIKLWKVSADGLTQKRVSATGDALEWRGDLSRTGDRIVFVTDASFFRVRTVATGAATPLLPLGGQVRTFPRSTTGLRAVTVRLCW